MPSKLERELSDPFRKAGCDRLVVYTPEVLRSALFNAVAQSQLEDVKLCVKRGASVEWRDNGETSCGLTTLQAAVCSNASTKDKISLIRYLLGERVNIDDIDYVESTALHFASALGDGEVVDFLLKNGANPKVYDAEALTPLHLAVNNGHIASVRALVNNWAPVDVSDIDFTGSDSHDRFKALSISGASLYIAKRGTPLHACAAANRMVAAKFLLTKAHADVNSNKGAHGCTPLHIACRAGNLGICKLLIQNGADLCAKDESGEEPLHRAIENGSVAIAKLLLDSGANASTPSNSGVTPVHIAAAFARKDMFRMLVSAGANLNQSCTTIYDDWDGGRTPLHYSAHNGNLEAFKLLIELGADVRQMSSIGWPPLFYAVEANRKEIVEHIAELDLKDNVHCIVDKKRTPLMVAAMQGAVESAEILMKAYPFTVNWQDDLGRTALHWGALRAKQDVIECILEHGGDASIRDKNGAKCGDLFPRMVKPSPKRQWEEERAGPQGEPVWNYKNIMENTSIRYMKRVMSARRTREIAHERQCNWCERYSFDAKRCSACKKVFYCSSECQKADWSKGGHRLHCVTKGLDEWAFSQLSKKTMK